MWSANQVANWFLVRHSSQMQVDESNDENLTQMKLHKLMYYAQGVNLAVFGGRLFNEELLAWQHGPVVRTIYDRFQGQKDLDDFVDENEISDYEDVAADSNSRMVLEAVYEEFGDYSASQLRKMTHSEYPWQNAWALGAGTTAISDDEIKSYFEENIVSV